MRRFLIIFLLMILPLQGAWAAAAGYCQHETGAAAKHLGHHEHKHETKKTDPAKGTSVVDNDCAVCHLGAAGMIPISALPSLPDKPQAERVSSHASLFSLIPADRPERPKWVRAV